MIGVVLAGKAKGYKKSVTSLSKDLASQIDLLIDFSLPENFEQVVRFCSQNKIALVSGVTGISDQQKIFMRAAAKKTPILWSSNMSLGIAILRRALQALGDLAEFDVQVVERHHRNKKDSPSGTAKTLHEDLKRLKTRSLAEPIGIRGGGIFGEHKVFLMSADETLVFEHQASGRSVFAVGAIKAALWLDKKQPGLYSIDDVLLQS